MIFFSTILKQKKKLNSEIVCHHVSPYEFINGQTNFWWYHLCFWNGLCLLYINRISIELIALGQSANLNFHDLIFCRICSNMLLKHWVVKRLDKMWIIIFPLIFKWGKKHNLKISISWPFWIYFFPKGIWMGKIATYRWNDCYYYLSFDI